MNPLLATLSQLDPLNDDHWTANGDPRIDAVEAIVGVKVTRAEIVGAAPDFDRTKAANPETLIMNQEKEPEQANSIEDASVLENEEVQETTPPSHYELLESKSGTVAGELLEKALVRGEGLADQDIFILQKELTADELEALRLGLEFTLVRNRQAADKMAKEEKLLRQNEAVIKNYLAVVRPEKSNQDAIKDYIQAQNDARAKSAQNRISILKNLDLSSISGLAPIDAAMSRKDSRGKTRPVYPT
jgi:hypothetical protein